MRGYRSPTIVALLAALTLGMWTSAANAASNIFGGWAYTSSTANFRGVRASIAASRGPWAIGSTEIYVNRVVSERYTSFNGLAQIGLLKAATNATYTGFNPSWCLTPSLATFGEYRNVNIATSYCATGTGLAAAASYNVRYRFTVQRVSACGTCWGGFINGVLRYTADVGYGPADAIFATGEVLDAGSTFTTKGGGEFGCTRAAGFTHSCASTAEREWEWTAGVNGTGETWAAVTASQASQRTASGFSFVDSPPGWWEVYRP